MKPTSEEVKKAVTLFVKNGGAVETIPPEKVPTQDQVGLFTGSSTFWELADPAYQSLGYRRGFKLSSYDP